MAAKKERMAPPEIPCQEVPENALRALRQRVFTHLMAGNLEWAAEALRQPTAADVNASERAALAGVQALLRRCNTMREITDVLAEFAFPACESAAGTRWYARHVVPEPALALLEEAIDDAGGRRLPMESASQLVTTAVALLKAQGSAKQQRSETPTAPNPESLLDVRVRTHMHLAQEISRC